MRLLNTDTILAALLLAPLTGLLVTASIADPATTLWFDRPAKNFHESLPLGNGRLGAMDLGGVDADRIILNESSVWSGGPYDANKYDAHRCLPEVREKLFAGDIAGAGNVLSRNFRYADGVKGWMEENQFGCYQTLGDLVIEFGGAARTRVTSPSGHGPGDGKGIENSVDGDPGTKWCVDKAGKSVLWQMELPAERAVTVYALTSADDVPTRDPQVWVLEGSADGKTWVELDRRSPGKPFEKRHQTKTFQIAKPGAYRFYRFNFTPQETYFQVAEISLAGAAASPLAFTDYRRELDLMTGLAITRYTHKGVAFTRELVASKPDEVIAVRLKADKPGALTFTAALVRRQHATAKRDGEFHKIEGQLPFNKPGGGGEGVRFVAWLCATTVGGKVSATDDGLAITGADEAMLIVSAGTSLFDKGFEAIARKRLDSALALPFDALRDRAIADHRSYMERCQLALPAGPNACKASGPRSTPRPGAAISTATSTSR